MSDVEFIFGGSFDPIHFGHLHIIDSLQSLNSGWPIRVLPCSVPALKKQTSASFSQRVEMIRLALKDYIDVTIDQREGLRTGKSYTYDTLKELAEEFPNRQFILVIGSDNLDSIGQWYQAKKLVKYCHLIIVNRPESSVDLYQTQLLDIGFQSAQSYKQLASVQSGLFYYYKITEMDTSSTAIRENLSQSRIKVTAEKNKVSQFNASGLLEHSQDIDLAASGNDLAELKKSTTSQMVDVFKIETPQAVKDYIKNNSIYW